MSALHPYAVCLSGVSVQQRAGWMLSEAEKIRSFPRIICQLVPDRVPREGIGRRGGWTSGSAVVVAALQQFPQLWEGTLGWKDVKSALVCVGRGCWSQSRDAAVTVGTSLPQNPLCSRSLDLSAAPCPLHAPLLARGCSLALFPPSPLHLFLGDVRVCSTWGQSEGITRLPGGGAAAAQDGRGPWARAESVHGGWPLPPAWDGAGTAHLPPVQAGMVCPFKARTCIFSPLL